MSEVKRYDTAEVGRNYDVRCGVVESSDGDYVLYSDYALLEEKLKIAMDALEDIVKDKAQTVYNHNEEFMRDANAAFRTASEKALEALKELRG